MVKAYSKSILPVLLIVLMLIPASGQKKRARLEKQRKDNQKRIEQTNKILAETEQEKSATLGQLNAITEQVRTRKQVIEDINTELRALQEEINGIRLLISGLDKDMSALKEEYAAMVYAASKADVYNRLMFLFSAETFNQFLARLRYMDQYAKSRRQQVAMMKQVRNNRLIQQRSLEIKQAEKEDLLESELTEKEKLVLAQNRKEQIVSKLAKKEKQLREEIATRQAADRKLERLISDLIAREMRRAARLARKREEAEASKRIESNKGAATPDKTPEPSSDMKYALTPEARILSNNFGDQRRRLNWPVEAGFISSGFGKQPHPVLKGIIIDNLGVDIQTNANQAVKAVFDGEVGFVASVPGVDGRIVSIMHGDYYTVYCNLKNISVNTGDKIKAKQVLGEVVTDKEGVSTLQFQVWRNNERLNPQNWLLRK